MMQWSCVALEICCTTKSPDVFMPVVGWLFSGSQKTIGLLTFASRLVGFCRIFIQSTQCPECNIGMKTYSHSGTWVSMSSTLSLWHSSCTHSGSTIWNHLLISGGSEYSIHKWKRVIIHVDAISPTVHNEHSSTSVKKTARSNRRQATWNLFIRPN